MPLPLWLAMLNLTKHMYDERVCQIEIGSFSPLVFSCCGEMGSAASVVYE